MPEFELLSQSEAEIKSAAGRGAETTREYLEYIERVQRGQAEKLLVIEGETAAASDGDLAKRLGWPGRSW